MHTHNIHTTRTPSSSSSCELSSTSSLIAESGQEREDCCRSHDMILALLCSMLTINYFQVQPEFQVYSLKAHALCRDTETIFSYTSINSNRGGIILSRIYVYTCTYIYGFKIFAKLEPSTRRRGKIGNFEVQQRTCIIIP